MKTYCDINCKKEFEIDLKEIISPNEIEVKYFKCTHCDSIYLVSAKDKKLKKMEVKLKKSTGFEFDRQLREVRAYAEAMKIAFTLSKEYQNL